MSIFVAKNKEGVKKMIWINRIKNIWRRCSRQIKQEIDYSEAKQMLKNDKEILLIDVRSPQEYKESHLDGAINLPLYDIEQQAEEKIKKKDTPIIIYCQSGSRSRKAIQILKQEDYQNLYEIEGGLDNI